MPRFAPGQATAAAILAAAALSAALASGQTAWYEGFEGPEPSWRAAGGNAQYRIELHQRIQGEAHTGDRCERLAIRGTGGSYVYFSHDVGRPPVIDELLPTVWIKSDRSGLQLFAQVVLTRVLDPRTGRPVSTMIPGSSYTNVGSWQQLRIDDLPRLLTRQVRVLRAELGPGVDEHEAYVESIVLNVYGGPGVTNVWIDDLDIAGYVGRPPSSAEKAAGTSGESGWGLSAGAVPRGQSNTAGAAGVGQSQRRRVELVGSVLLADGRPMFPRIIQYQGEPLALLSRLGFNAVWLQGPPSPELISEAERAHLWLVCPPPNQHGLEPSDSPITAPADIGPEFDRVLAWDLGKGLWSEQLEPTRRRAEQLRLADRHRGRPLVGQADGDLRSYSRYLDVLLFGRQPLGTSLELTDYGAWLRGRPLLARPGTPMWTTVQTQLAPAASEQLGALDPGHPAPTAVSGEQIQLLAYMGVASGSRGLLFLSQTPLGATDAETRQRAMTLELLNLELALIEPWAAAGTFVSTVGASEPQVTGTALRTDRARLLLPIWSAPGAQYVPGQSAGNSVWLVVPGVPESSTAYELTPGGLRPLRHKRVIGGMQVTLDEFGLVSLVLLAQDPLIISTLSQQSISAGPRLSELQRHQAARKLHVVEQVAAELSGRAAPPPQSAEWLSTARQSLQWCDGQLAAKEYQAAYLSAQRAMRALRLWERAAWEAAVGRLPSPAASPAALSFATLPWHWKLVDRLAGWRPGPNRLPAGDFEDLNAMLQSGWQHFQHRVEGVPTAAELLPAAAHSGRLGLRLAAWAEDPKNPPGIIETPPLWITTPAVPVQAGDLVRIHGWVQTPAPLEGTVDGLLIVESLSGEPLAERIGRTTGWREFTLYRSATHSGACSVTFALSGLGEAWLDDVTVQTLQPPGAGGVTQRPPPAAAPR